MVRIARTERICKPGLRVGLLWSVAVVLARLTALAALETRPHQGPEDRPEPTERPTPQQPMPGMDLADTARLLLYLERGRELGKRIREQDARVYLGQVQSWREQAARQDVDGGAERITESLQDSALTFDGEVPENQIVNPMSREVALAFRELHRRRHFDLAPLIGLLAAGAEHLAEPWLPLVTDTLDGAEPQSGLWWVSAQILRRRGAAPPGLGAAMLACFRARHEGWMAEDLLFRRNTTTGSQEPVLDVPTLTWYTELVAEDPMRLGPEVAVACAAYAVAISDIATAQHLCLEVLYTPYQHLVDLSAPIPQSDESLLRAKQRALPLLFYGVCNRTAFEAVLDLARRPERELAEHLNDPAPFVSLAFTPLGRLDIELAKSLIWEIDGLAAEPRPQGMPAGG